MSVYFLAGVQLGMIKESKCDVVVVVFVVVAVVVDDGTVNVYF